MTLKAVLLLIWKLSCVVATVWLLEELFTRYVVDLWSYVVIPEKKKALVINFSLVILFIFLCSCSELSLSETSDRAINDALRRLYQKYEQQQHRPIPFACYYYFLKLMNYLKNISETVNTSIVLANTILTIYLAVSTLSYLTENNNPPRVTFPLPLIRDWLSNVQGQDAFSIIGITLFTFLIGEVIPKQIAIAAKENAFFLCSLWILVILGLFGVPSTGILTILWWFVGAVRWLHRRIRGARAPGPPPPATEA